jgi:hypothetical protein
MMAGQLKVEWFGARRKAPKPDPAFPAGVDIECGACGYQGAVAAAGQADDPRSVKVGCRT